MVKRWDEQSQAYIEPVNVPMRYDDDSQAYVETAGMAYDQTEQAWTEVWGQKVSTYVYGAVLETVTIKKDGIIVATVATNSDGVSDEQIELAYGTYTLTGSVSGWTEEQTIGKDTTKFRAMPEGALYWYGNECTDVTGGWEVGAHTTYVTPSKETNYLNMNIQCINSEKTCGYITTKNMVSVGNITTLHNMSYNESFIDDTGKNYVYIGASGSIPTGYGPSMNITSERIYGNSIAEKTSDFSSIQNTNQYFSFGFGLWITPTGKTGNTRTYAIWLE